MKTKSKILPSLLTLTACASFVAETAKADNYTLPAIDPGGTSSLTNPLTGNATGWTGGDPSTTKNAPTAGNTYTVGGGASLIAVRGPTTGETPTFPGDSLTLLGNGRLLLKTPNNLTQTVTVSNLILDGGFVDLANTTNSGSIATLAGNVKLAANSANGGIGALGGETLIVESVISGGNPLVVGGAKVNAGGANGKVILVGANLNTAGSILNSGTVLIGVSNATTVSGPLGVSTSDVQLGAGVGTAAVSLLTNGAFTLSNNITVRAGGTGVVTFGGNTPDESTFSGTVTLDQSVTVALPFGGTLNLPGEISSGAAGTRTLNFATRGDVLQSGVIGNGVGSVAVSQSLSGSTILSGNNTFSGVINIYGGGKISVSTINRVVGGTPSSNLGAPVTALAGTLRFGGSGAPGTLVYTGLGETTDRAIDLPANTNGSDGVLEQSGAGLLNFTGGVLPTGGTVPKTLFLQGSTAGAGEISGPIADGVGPGLTGVTKDGSGTWTLSGANTYSGTTSVFGGTLVLKTPTLDGASSVVVSTPGKLKLDYVGTATVAALNLDGSQLSDGIYDSSDSSGRLIGGGKIRVLSTSFAVWSAMNANRQGPDLDFDGDGVPNGVEYFMNEMGSSFTSTPGIVGITITYPKNPDFEGVYQIQTSPDLVEWTEATTGITDNGTSVIFEVPNVPGKLFVRLAVDVE